MLEGRYRWWLAVRAGRRRRRCSAPLQATPRTLTRAATRVQARRPRDLPHSEEQGKKEEQNRNF